MTVVEPRVRPALPAGAAVGAFAVALVLGLLLGVRISDNLIRIVIVESGVERPVAADEVQLLEVSGMDYLAVPLDGSGRATLRDAAGHYVCLGKQGSWRPKEPSGWYDLRAPTRFVYRCTTPANLPADDAGVRTIQVVTG